MSVVRTVEEMPRVLKKKYDLPITRAVFGEEELAAVQEPLRTGWVVQGPKVAEFEDKFSRHTGARHSIATTSCTTALHLAVRALGLKPGDEVIVPAFTWVSTANVVEYEGGTPVFCDIDLTTFNIDVDRLEALITPRTVGMIPVHLFGLCADMPRILAAARRHGLWIVEDAACAFGAWIGQRHAGTFGDAGCFSFHPRKSITTGEGGMITTADAGLAGACRSLRDHGATRTDLQRHESKAAFLLAEYNVVGFNYRMTDLQGALGSVQMDRADAILASRRSLARSYDEALADVAWLRPPVVPSGYVHGYQSYVTLFAPEQPTLDNVQALHDRRNDLMQRLEDMGISTRQGTHAPVLLNVYRDKYRLRAEDYPCAFVADRLSLTLPLAAQMSEVDVAMVAAELRSAVR
jgi:perosamine synthetase